MEEESRKSFAQITLYNQLIKEMDDLYRVYAKNCNLSETAFWILYCIRELSLIHISEPTRPY